VLGFDGPEFEACLGTIAIARRTVLDAVLNIQAAVVSRFGSLGLLALTFAFPVAFRRGFWLRIVWGF